ncbi:hypothetical protein PYV02_04025 [Leifsonia sp. H3M29-4]|uniref:hypothetical protein n=1 Tax=Salinibacterium metalliresistens TaxID=3031321 RepID=UPI0023DC2ABE|nr:hypothetical protein [Salinibacterium metalliresistens]MDF1478243.1 hypothetical protein [Salinibacterium metalliresistens]
MVASYVVLVVLGFLLPTLALGIFVVHAITTRRQIRKDIAELVVLGEHLAEARATGPQWAVDEINEKVATVMSRHGVDELLSVNLVAFPLAILRAADRSTIADGWRELALVAAGLLCQAIAALIGIGFM